MRIKPIKQFNCALTPPPDKSITIRAAIMGWLAFGKTEITNPLICGDTVSALNAVSSLGAEVEFSHGKIDIRGGVFRDGAVDSGNSATTLRLLCGAASGRCNVSFTGDSSLSKRNMRPLIDALSGMGATISSKNGFLPIRVTKSELSGIDLTMTEPSAQIKSAVLLAGLSASGETSVTERIQTRTHTEDMLELFGADIIREKTRTTVKKCDLKGAKIDVPGDISSAAYPMVLALKRGYCYLKNVGTSRRRLIDFLREIGGDITEESSGNRADLIVKMSDLRPFDIDEQTATALIDELPLLATLACTLKGRSTISGAKALHGKECDRIACTVTNLRNMGAEIQAKPDGFVIDGGELIGGNATANGDHRMAMSMAVACALSQKGGTVDDDKCVQISYPSFWELFE